VNGNTTTIKINMIQAVGTIFVMETVAKYINIFPIALSVAVQLKI